VKLSGCPVCGSPLDCGDYARKPRGELGEAADAYMTRASFCCRRDGCRKRATPACLRFLGRKVYVGALVVIASAVGRQMRLIGAGTPRRVHGVPVRTVRRWLDWWSTAFVLHRLWSEARAMFATPVEEALLPASLLERFGKPTGATLTRLLAFVSPVTTTLDGARITIDM
jgi:hypothetical protein